jgi:hypothetical protein
VSVAAGTCLLSGCPGDERIMIIYNIELDVVVIVLLRFRRCELLLLEAGSEKGE